MNDLISRSALIVELQKGTIISDDLYGMGIMSGVDFATKRIAEAPAVDAVEVRHGRWVMTIYTTTSKRGRVISNTKFECSECGYGNGRKKNNYCPNCGAKMDEEARNV